MQTFDNAKISNPEFYKENCLKAHSDHVYYPSWEAYRRGENPYRYSLNGLWKFSYARNLSCAVPDFADAAYDCQLIFRWKGMMCPSMPTRSIRGTAGRKSALGKFRRRLIRWRTMSRILICRRAFSGIRYVFPFRVRRAP